MREGRRAGGHADGHGRKPGRPPAQRSGHKPWAAGERWAGFAQNQQLGMVGSSESTAQDRRRRQPARRGRPAGAAIVGIHLDDLAAPARAPVFDTVWRPPTRPAMRPSTPGVGGGQYVAAASRTPPAATTMAAMSSQPGPPAGRRIRGMATLPRGHHCPWYVLLRPVWGCSENVPEGYHGAWRGSSPNGSGEAAQ